MRRLDHRDIAAIVALIDAPITLTNAVAIYMGYAIPFGRITALSSNQRVAAALLSNLVVVLLMLAILFVLLSQINKSSAFYFSLSCLAVALGGVVLAAFQIALLDPLLADSAVHSWLAPIVLGSAGIWMLSGFLFYMGFGEGPYL